LRRWLIGVALVFFVLNRVGHAYTTPVTITATTFDISGITNSLYVALPYTHYDATTSTSKFGVYDDTLGIAMRAKRGQVLKLEKQG
jgi:hypothetical protein